MWLSWVLRTLSHKAAIIVLAGLPYFAGILFQTHLVVGRIVSWYCRTEVPKFLAGCQLGPLSLPEAAYIPCHEALS